ncbi:MAG TPA: anthranilate phosphoribosyltransferase, partial [Gemmatimonadales bacterium]|nr:anthranilate phosphoribosyltransferase [Gemmatimonadales bacterium]
MTSTSQSADPLQSALTALERGQHLTAGQAAAAFGVVMRGEASAHQIKALLLGLRAKGETFEEIAGAAQALRQAMITVNPSAGSPVVDTCGTGGGKVGTFNISTAAGFVVAAAGVRVAKHGNRSYTSKCGSADVLEALGVDITVSHDRIATLLDHAGMVFLFAPNFHPAMRHVGPVRKELGVATVMNLLGPLANPAGVTRQVIGVADSARAPQIAQALVRLGSEHALVVHAEVGMDEISTAGATRVWEVRSGKVTQWTIEAANYGQNWTEVEHLAGGDPKDNAARIERLLAGSTEDDEAGKRAVILNAAAG